MNRAILITIAVLALVALAGCISTGGSEDPADVPNGKTIETGAADDVNISIDTEANGTGGLCCLPLNNTTLDGGPP